MLYQCVAVAFPGDGEAKAWVIEGHAPEAVPEPDDEVAVDEGPGGPGVQEQERRSRPFVDVVHLVSVNLYVAALERVEPIIEP